MKYTHSITKRSFKNFTVNSWNESLAQQDWLEVDDEEDVNGMVTQFNKKRKQFVNVSVRYKGILCLST